MKSTIFAGILVLSLSAVSAQTVEVSNAWVRTAVTGQSGTGAFMSLLAKDSVKLVAVSSPVSGLAEVHEMKMEGDVMRMRAVPVLDLPAGQAVHLKPGGYHIMLMQLKQALPKGSTAPLTLTFRDSKGQESRVELKLPVAATAPGAAATHSGSGHKH